MSLEPIKFKCDGCGLVSDGQLDFTYYDEVQPKREWILRLYWEYTNGTARCQHCGHMCNVWPKVHVDRVWEKRK